MRGLPVWSRRGAVAIAVTLLAFLMIGPVHAQPGFSLRAAKPGHGVIYIGRPFGWHTSVFSLTIALDGKPLVSLAPNQYARVEVAAGRHVVGVPDTTWNRLISGTPHPVSLSVQAGKSYFLLPNRWAGEERMGIAIVGSVVVPTRTADAHASFSVQTDKAPPAFNGLTQAEPDGR